jgi:general secretion pathway protein D
MGNASSARNQNNVSAKGQARLESGEKITLNLKDADLGAVISTVSELTGKNFIVDPRVKGKVTVISSRPLTKDAVYQVFLSVLNVQGFAVVPGRGASKIVPIVNAKQDAVPTVTSRAPGRGDEYITRVIQVQNVSVAQLVPILRPLLSQQAHLAAYPPSNVLIASGEAANVDRLVKLINRIDTAGDEAVDIVPLAHASAPEIVRILQSVEKATEKDQAAVGRPTLVADERTNSIIVSGGPEQRVRLRTLITQLDSPSEKSGNTEVVYLKNAKAKDLATVLTGMSGSFTGAAGKDGKPAATPPAAGKENLAIQADEATNALVISAAPDVMRSIKSVIRQLDVRRAQVLVEAVIAEVSVNRAKEFGVQWGYDGSSTNNPVGLINFGGSGSGIVSVAAAVVAENPAGVNLDGASLFAGDTQPNGDRFGAFVRALAGDGDTNILSTPSLVTMDNEEAEIVVGQNVPFVTGSYSSTSSGAGSSVSNPFQTIQRQDVGLTLKVRPQINEGNAVKLVVNQEVSSLTSGTSGAADLITNKRSLKTTVMVDSGQVLVLGGLIDETLTQSEQKVPLLGDIPILGWLFSYKKTTKEKRNLMVFLHPTILRDEVQNATVSGDKYTYMRARQLDMRERGVKLMSDNESPLLPELQDLMMLPPPFKAGVTPEKPTETPMTPAAPAQQNGAR